MKRSIGKKPAIIPTPVLIIGTYDPDGKPNVMTAAWGGVCSSDPLSISFSVQRSRHTYAALMKNKECTISIPSASHVTEADFFGIVSGKTVDKFAATGLTPKRGNLVNAPYVEEFPLVMECRITRVVDIGVHDHFIAEVLDVSVDEQYTDLKGQPDLGSIRFFYYHPLERSYHATGEFLMKAFSAGSLFQK
ncbi:MAG: flavin reductase family protein [Methanospirillum sp.]|nr:flavin reductase family protein [Methanospirillum sp.]